AINHRIERLRLERRQRELKGITDPAVFAALDEERRKIDAEYDVLAEELGKLNEQSNRDSVVMVTAEGTEKEIPLAKIVFVEQPNSLGLGGRIGHFLGKLWEFV